MKINKIKELLNKNFINYIIKYKNILGVNNIELNSAFINSKWIGTNLCGPSSVICYFILSKNNYET